MTRLAVEPMRPHAVEPVGLAQPVHYLGETFQPVGTADESVVDTHKKTSDAEATSTGGHDILVVLGVVAIKMDALACQSGIGFRPIPHIIEMYALYEIKHLIIVGKRRWPDRVADQLAAVGLVVPIGGSLLAAHYKAKGDGRYKK